MASVNLSLRDAIVDFAARQWAYFRKLIQASQPFEAIPLLTKILIREHADDLLAEGISENRRVAKPRRRRGREYGRRCRWPPPARSAR